MQDFSRHFLMSCEDAINYTRLKTDFFPLGASLSCTEIGDGNINYVFRIKDNSSGRSLILKQADTRTRSGKNPLDTERNRIEALALQTHGRLAPGLVPEVYLYDRVMAAIVMEDLHYCNNMRHALIKRQTFPRFAEDITTFMANTLMGTCDSIMPAKEKRTLAGRFVNPDLCDISERLVFTDPYTNKGGENLLFEQNREFLERELYHDSLLLTQAAILKHRFESSAQCLLHGDLHTGSIFVSQSDTKVLDPEFAFFGPAGYDVGNLLANLIFAWTAASVSEEQCKEADSFIGWLEQTIEEVFDTFFKKADIILKESTTDIMYKGDEYKNWFLRQIMSDTAGMAGMELNRRIIGDAKVLDITGIQNPAGRVLAERTCVTVAKRLIFDRFTAFTSGREYVDTIKLSLKAVHEDGGKQE